MQVLQQQLHHELVRQAGLGQRRRRRRAAPGSAVIVAMAVLTACLRSSCSAPGARARAAERRLGSAASASRKSFDASSHCRAARLHDAAVERAAAARPGVRERLRARPSGRPPAHRPARRCCARSATPDRATARRRHACTRPRRVAFENPAVAKVVVGVAGQRVEARGALVLRARLGAAAHAPGTACPACCARPPTSARSRSRDRRRRSPRCGKPASRHIRASASCVTASFGSSVERARQVVVRLVVHAQAAVLLRHLAIASRATARRRGQQRRGERRIRRLDGARRSAALRAARWPRSRGTSPCSADSESAGAPAAAAVRSGDGRSGVTLTNRRSAQPAAATSATERMRIRTVGLLSRSKRPYSSRVEAGAAALDVEHERNEGDEHRR